MMQDSRYCKVVTHGVIVEILFIFVSCPLPEEAQADEDRQRTEGHREKV